MRRSTSAAIMQEKCFGSRTDGLAFPGEEIRYDYTARGVTAVIAPWNFPLAILCGMTTAALVAGNPVVMKPSGAVRRHRDSLCAASFTRRAFQPRPFTACRAPEQKSERPSSSILKLP